MPKFEIAAIGAVSIGACVLAAFAKPDIRAALVYTGWALLVTFVVSLALYRLTLSVLDHRARRAIPNISGHSHQWFQHRESIVDHIGIPLTFCALLYTIAATVFTANELMDATIRKFVTLLTLH